MVESNRLKKLTRQYMAKHPGTKYQRALEAVQNGELNPRPFPAAAVSAADADTWLQLLGGVPNVDELAQRWAASLSTSVRALGVQTEPNFVFGEGRGSSGSTSPRRSMVATVPMPRSPAEPAAA